VPLNLAFQLQLIQFLLPRLLEKCSLKATKGIVVVLIYSIFVIVNFMQNYVISLEIY
jgi:hypothetical protein